MPLTAGDQLGPYEILSPLGAGGMGEVYRARDTKLNRDVAIKVLPAGLANDADYLARFQREAQALAALHHPNIATIFGLEQNAIVMELVEGQNPKGPLPLNDALNIARQIAEALEAAHDKGIIHRDLKPGNVIVTPEGVVKVLDFGLAKTAEKSAGPTTADSPTLTMRATEAGLILGTAGYMSPEQAAGKPVDRRADIWSFGVVLHELLTGKRLFDGETVSHTLAHVLTADVDLTKISAGPIRDLIRRCLDRNLKTRLRDIGEARIAIESYLAHPPQERQPAPTQTSRWPWAIAAVCLLAAGAAWMRRPAEAPALPTKLTVEPPEGGRFTPFPSSGGSAISPDGRTIAFVVTTAKGETLLHVRSLDSLEARALPGTEDAARPFWSPNSKTVAFVARTKLKRIELAGGGPTVLCDVKFGRGGTWNESDVILFGEIRSGLQRVPASGGTPAFVTRRNEEAGEQNHYFPQFLPDGKRFLYLVRNRDTAKSGIFVTSLDGESARRIVQTQNRAIYDPAAGRLLFVQDNGTLMAQRLELDSLRLTGDAAPVAAMGTTGGQNPNGYANFSVAGNGTLLYAPEAAADLARIAWRDRSGKLLEAVGQPLPNVDALSLSPDRRRLAFTTSSAELAGIPILDLTSGLVTRLTLTPTIGTPRWSSDGKQIYYYFQNAIRRRAADGSGEEEAVAQVAGQLVTAISPDGKYLLADDLAGEVRVYPLIGPAAERKPEPALQFKARGSNSFSPDGRWLALASDESGRSEVYVQGFAERRGRWPVSAGGGNFPTWRGDGKELYWLAPDGTLMAASVELQESSVRVGRAEPLFRLARPLYQPSADGRRFLVLDPVGDAPREKSLVVVQNWSAGLAK